MPRNPTTNPIHRLQSVTSQLQKPSQDLSATSKMAEKDPITCHVLDTTTGRPAAHIAVTLSCLAQPSLAFTSTTNSDGRIANWSNTQEPNSAEASFVQGEGSVANAIRSLISKHAAAGGQQPGNKSCPPGSSLWKLQFQTGEYYGAEKCFFPVVELTFLVKEGEHFHVPLLLGPYSFTTYRGS